MQAQHRQESQAGLPRGLQADLQLQGRPALGKLPREQANRNTDSLGTQTSSPKANSWKPEPESYSGDICFSMSILGPLLFISVSHTIQ